MSGLQRADCVLFCSGAKEVFVVESRSYMGKLVEQANLHFMVTGKVKETSQIVSAMKVVTLHNPKLTITVWNYSYSLELESSNKCAKTSWILSR